MKGRTCRLIGYDSNTASGDSSIMLTIIVVLCVRSPLLWGVEVRIQSSGSESRLKSNGSQPQLHGESLLRDWHPFLLPRESNGLGGQPEYQELLKPSSGF